MTILILSVLLGLAVGAAIILKVLLNIQKKDTKFWEESYYKLSKLEKEHQDNLKSEIAKAMELAQGYKQAMEEIRTDYFSYQANSNSLIKKYELLAENNEKLNLSNNRLISLSEEALADANKKFDLLLESLRDYAMIYKLKALRFLRDIKYLVQNGHNNYQKEIQNFSKARALMELHHKEIVGFLKGVKMDFDTKPYNGVFIEEINEVENALDGFDFQD